MTSVASSSERDLPDSVARLALAVAAGAMVLMPLAMWLASRSAPLLLVIAAVACLVALVRETGLAGLAAAPMWRLSPTSAQAGVALGVAGFLALALVSILWSHDRVASLRAYGELGLSLAAGVVVAAVLPGRAPRWAGAALAFSLPMACVLTVFELSGMHLWRMQAGMSAYTFIFNRTLITVLVLALPLMAWLAGTRYRLAMLPVAALVAGAIFISESGAARLGLLVAAGAGVAAMLAPRLSLLAAAAGLVALMCFAPVQGELVERTIPASAHRQLEDAHSRDRMIIWLAYGQAIRAKPLFGSGFGSSATLHRHPVAMNLPEKDRIWLAVGHPHSAQVQAWVETGFAGAAMLLFAGLNLLVIIMRMPDLWRCAAFATFAGAISIAAVGHGAWQGWWIAALGASIVWFRVLMAQSRRDALPGDTAEK
jgi:O-antigen ligase